MQGNLNYRIYSIKRPGRLLNFWTLRVGAYSRWALIRGWALIKFSPFSAVVSLFCNKTINNKKPCGLYNRPCDVFALYFSPFTRSSTIINLPSPSLFAAGLTCRLKYRLFTVSFSLVCLSRVRPCTLENSAAGQGGGEWRDWDDTGLNTRWK